MILSINISNLVMSQFVCFNHYEIGFTYFAAMGVCGLVLVSIATNLSTLAANIESTSVDIGTVFLSSGIGAMIGSIGMI